MEQNNYKKKIINGVKCALIVVLLGFVIMNILWIFNDKDINLKGLYDYKAATLGDGLFLPILVGSLVAFTSFGLNISQKQKIISHIIGAMFSIVAIIEQRRWLTDENIGLNWTLPEPHKFNFAGWYHAVFFVVMFYLISMLLIKLWFKRKNENSSLKNPFYIICYYLIWFSGTAFILSFVLDDFSSNINFLPLLISVSLIMLLFSTIFNITSAKKIVLYEFFYMVSSIITALGLVLSLKGHFSWVALFALVSTLFAFTLIIHNAVNVNLMIAYAIIIVLPIASINFALATIGLKIELIVLAIITPCLVSYAQYGNYNDTMTKSIFNRHLGTGMTLYIFNSLTIILFSSEIDISAIVNLILCSIVINIVIKSIKENFSYVVKSQVEKNNASIDLVEEKVLEQSKNKLASYILISTVGIGAIIYLILTLLKMDL